MLWTTQLNLLFICSITATRSSKAPFSSLTHVASIFRVHKSATSETMLFSIVKATISSGYWHDMVARPCHTLHQR